MDENNKKKEHQKNALKKFGGALFTIATVVVSLWLNKNKQQR
jgi:hypothetical protein